MAWYHQVQAGDVVAPDPAWNQSERLHRRLPSAVTVLEVKNAVSQSGVLFRVQFVGGHEHWLDAGWFTGKVQQQAAFEM